MMRNPPIIHPDIELWATQWLRDALAEHYPDLDVWVSNEQPDPGPQYIVTVRRDGGSRHQLLDRPRLNLQVWAPSKQKANDLIRHIRALLWTAPDGNPVCKVVEQSGPYGISDDSGLHRRMMIFELIVRDDPSESL